MQDSHPNRTDITDATTICQLCRVRSSARMRRRIMPPHGLGTSCDILIRGRKAQNLPSDRTHICISFRYYVPIWRGMAWVL